MFTFRGIYIDGSRTLDILLNEILKEVLYSSVSKSFTEKKQVCWIEVQVQVLFKLFHFGICNRPDAIKKIRGRENPVALLFQNKTKYWDETNW